MYSRSHMTRAFFLFLSHAHRTHSGIFISIKRPRKNIIFAYVYVCALLKITRPKDQLTFIKTIEPCPLTRNERAYINPLNFTYKKKQSFIACQNDSRTLCIYLDIYRSRSLMLTRFVVSYYLLMLSDAFPATHTINALESLKCTSLLRMDMIMSRSRRRWMFDLRN